MTRMNRRKIRKFSSSGDPEITIKFHSHRFKFKLMNTKLYNLLNYAD